MPRKRKRRRIIGYGDGCDLTTGFAEVMKRILTGLEKRGWEIVGQFGINSQGMPDKRFSFPIYSAQQPYGMGEPDPYGRTRFLQYLDKCPNFDVLFMLQDSFIMSHSLDFAPHDGGEVVREPFVQAAVKRAREKGAATSIYFPVDATPWGDWYSGFEAADSIVTYTDWGVREVSAVCPSVGNKLKRIYHGCDPEFFSHSQSSKQELKDKWIPDKKDRFIILWVGANQRRKRLDLVFKSFRYFLDNYCSNATMVLRTNVGNPMYVGWNLQRLTGLFEFTSDEIVFVGRDIAREGLRDLYQMADVGGPYIGMEGWGLCVTEMMAAGTPTVLTDHSSFSEIGGRSGERALMAEVRDGPDGYDVLSSDYEVRRLVPDIREIARLLNNVRENPEGTQIMAARALAWCLENTWDHVVDQWDEHLTQLLVA